MKIKTLTLAIMLAPLAGCTPNDITMGGALRHNMAMQTINPDPQYAGAPMEGADGERAARVVAAYKKGMVKQPAAVNTTTIISSGTGSGSGSGSGTR